MLTKDDKRIVKALIILTSIALVSEITALVLVIIGKYYGFVGASPITCTVAYFKLKFTDINLFLSSSFSALIISLLTSALLMAQFIILLVRMGRNRDANGNSLEDKLPAYYLIASIAQLGISVTFAWYLSIFFQGVKECNYSISIQLIIILAASSLAFITVAIVWIMLVFLASKRPTLPSEIKEQPQKPEKISTEKIQKQVKLEKQGRNSDKKLPLLQKQQNRKQNQQAPIQYKLKVQTALNSKQPQTQQIRGTNPIRGPSQYIQPQLERKYSQSSQHKEKYEPQKRQATIIRQQSRFVHQPQIAIPSTPSAPSQNVTHINFNFPNNFAQNPVPTVSNEPVKENLKEEGLKKERDQQMRNYSRKQVIRQSPEQDKQSDSDDRFYKRGKKNKSKGYRFQEKRRKQSQYERQYDKIDNKFKHSPLEPRYIVLSPDSMKKFYEFVSAEQSAEDKHPFKQNVSPNKVKNNRKDKAYPVQNPRLSKSKLSLSAQPHFEVTVVPKKQQKYQQYEREKNNDYILSQVNEGFHPSEVSNLKEGSFYEYLQDKQSFKDDFKKYQRFFKSRVHSQPQKQQIPYSFEDYFDVLNNSTHTKNKNSGSQLQSNYSSILNQQYKGKIPTQRESNHPKIKIHQNYIKQASPKKSESIYNKIKHKYK